MGVFFKHIMRALCLERGGGLLFAKEGELLEPEHV